MSSVRLLQNPTTYRSIIYYHERLKRIATVSIKAIG